MNADKIRRRVLDFLYALNELMQEIEQVKPESVHDREDDELCWKLVTHVVSRVHGNQWYYIVDCVFIVKYS